MNRVFKKTAAFLSSLRLSVVCLLYCVIIVIGGTFYQVDNGLYAAQERFFRSWVLLLFGFFPLPGLQTVLTLVLVNVLVAGKKHLALQWKKIGLVLMHGGVILLIGGTGLSSRFVKESIITIAQGQFAEESVDLQQWDVSVTISGLEDGAAWSASQSFPLSTLKPGRSFKLSQANKIITVKHRYASCEARGKHPGATDTLIPLSPGSDGGNIPGLVLVYGDTSQRAGNPDMLVFGGEGEPAHYQRLGDSLSVSLLPKRVKLPLKIGLVDFVLEKHLGTSSAKKIQSRIRAKGEGIDREIVVSMNRPFRYRSLTFYQTGFSENNGPRTSTLTVVENPVRFLPHAASVLIISGLLFHFCFRMVQVLKSTRRKQNG